MSGTASDRKDYTLDAYVLVIPKGQDSNVIRISALRDSELEGPEELVIRLQASQGAQVGKNAALTIRILDRGVTADDPEDVKAFLGSIQRGSLECTIRYIKADPRFTGSADPYQFTALHHAAALQSPAILLALCNTYSKQDKLLQALCAQGLLDRRTPWECASQETRAALTKQLFPVSQPVWDKGLAQAPEQQQWDRLPLYTQLRARADIEEKIAALPKTVENLELEYPLSFAYRSGEYVYIEFFAPSGVVPDVAWITTKGLQYQGKTPMGEVIAISQEMRKQIPEEKPWRLTVRIAEEMFRFECDIREFKAQSFPIPAIPPFSPDVRPSSVQTRPQNCLFVMYAEALNKQEQIGEWRVKARTTRAFQPVGPIGQISEDQWDTDSLELLLVRSIGAKQYATFRSEKIQQIIDRGVSAACNTGR